MASDSLIQFPAAAARCTPQFRLIPRFMKSPHAVLFAMLLLLALFHPSARAQTGQGIPKPGVYSGSLTVTRSVIAYREAPNNSTTRAATVKSVIKAAGIVCAPTDPKTPYMDVVLGEASIDNDRAETRMTIDFATDPAKVSLIKPGGTIVVQPQLFVLGNVVTLIFQNGNVGTGVNGQNLQEIKTLKLVRTKP